VGTNTYIVCVTTEVEFFTISGREVNCTALSNGSRMHGLVERMEKCGNDRDTNTVQGRVATNTVQDRVATILYKTG
jgi:hypothetical protein